MTPGIPWRPIAELPDALKDGREVLFYFRAVAEGEASLSISGYWWGNTWRLPIRCDWFDATHFAEINPLEGS